MGSVWLMYHDVHEVAPRPDLPRSATMYHVSRATFAGHLAAIKASGRRVLTVGGFLRQPDDSVVITFDDGWRGAFDIALPLLVNEGWRATFFVTRDFIGRSGFCDGEALAAAARAGMEIGVHGTTHRMLSACTRDEILEEFASCKSHLEGLLSRPVSLASLPGGDVNRTIVACAQQAGLRCLCTSRPGLNHAGTSRFDLRRVAIKMSTSDADVARYCRHGLGREIARWRLLQIPRSLLRGKHYSRLRRRFLGEHGHPPHEVFEP
jgi:peptidoglycan/xylan/chitin deacetylase (PgdA/CDA1 family)